MGEKISLGEVGASPVSEFVKRYIDFRNGNLHTFLFFYFYTISYRSYRRLHTRIIDFHNMQNKDILLQTVKLRLKDFM